LRAAAERLPTYREPNREKATGSGVAFSLLTSSRRKVAVDETIAEMGNIIFFLKASLRHWVSLVTGSLFMALLGIYQGVGHTVAHWVYWTIAIGAIVPAFYLMWVDEHKQVEALKNEAASQFPRSSTNMVNANPVQTMSPTIEASPKVEIHNYPFAPSSPTPKAPPKPEPTHNIQFTGAKQVISDLGSDLLPEDDEHGVPTLKACFLNRSIPGKRVADFEHVTARVVFKTISGHQIAEVCSPAWLNHPLENPVHIECNRSACLIVAFFAKQKWRAAHITSRPAAYWEHGGIEHELDSTPIPSEEELVIEIDVVDADNIGLPTATVRAIFGSDGTVTIKS
jgi:hypothetical protein